MIQRKQTLYLLLSIIVSVVCVCMPVGLIEPKGMGVQTMLWNFCAVGPNGTMSFGNWPLFGLLVVTIPMELAAIFLYRNRKLQIKLCTWSIIFCLAWCVYYAFSAFNTFQMNGIFHVQFAACLPLVSAISLVLARRGIVHDEKLVKSADRIR